MPSEYQMFVKEHIHQFDHLQPKERIKAVAQLYRQQKGLGNVRAKKQAKGAGLFGSIGDAVDGVSHMFGMGLPMEKKQKKSKAPKKAPAKKSAKANKTKGGVMTGAGLFDMIPHLLTAGLF